MATTVATTAATRVGGRIYARHSPLIHIVNTKIRRNQPYRWNSATPTRTTVFNPSNPTHLIFGANTDVGKTIVSAGLVRASIRDLNRGGGEIDRMGFVHYLKPLQCGGSDEKFVERHAAGGGGGGVSDDSEDEETEYFVPGLMCTTLFEWDTPASPHVSSRLEGGPASDEEVVGEVRETLNATGDAAATIVETAGGVMSPSSASPLNGEAWHARWVGGDDGDSETSEDDPAASSPSPPLQSARSWGWSTQADLYSPPFSRLNLPTLLVGDGRLGGISVTLASFEALESRGYPVRGIVLVDDGHFGRDNARALEEYIASTEGRRERRRRMGLSVNTDEPRAVKGGGQVGVHLLPAIPPMPEPLDGWFAQPEVEDTFQEINTMLSNRWRHSR